MSARRSPCEPVSPFAPWDAASSTTNVPELAGGTDVAGAADGLIAFYQRHLRAPILPGYGCQFHPSCSVYARQAFRRYGLAGLVFALDRLLIREHAFIGAQYLTDCGDGTPRNHDSLP